MIQDLMSLYNTQIYFGFTTHTTWFPIHNLSFTKNNLAFFWFYDTYNMILGYTIWFDELLGKYMYCIISRIQNMVMVIQNVGQAINKYNVQVIDQYCLSDRQIYGAGDTQIYDLGNMQVYDIGDIQIHFWFKIHKYDSNLLYTSTFSYLI